MATTPVVIDRFGGLNVADDSTSIGDSATDLLNVDIDRSGRIRTRCGYSLVKAITLTTADGLASFESSSGTSQFVVGHTNAGTKKYEAYASTGGAVVASATPTATAVNAVRWGDTGAERLYIANGADATWAWDGAAFTQPAGMPTSFYLTGSGESNRLVAGRISGARNQVRFSDAGAPATWGANNFVELTPGDGSPVTGLASFQNDVYAFKNRRFFVFYSESTDQDGEPVFNYRTIEGYGAIVQPVAGDEGVYFFDGRTVWVTTGGMPTKVSRVIEPLLAGISSGTLTGLDQTQLANVKLSYSLGRLYLTMPVLGSYTMAMVFDPRIDAWTVHIVNAGVKWITTLKPASTEQKFTFFFADVGAGTVNKFDPSLTQDAGSPIVWSWSGGLTDMGEPGRVKVSLESRAWGVGSVGMNVAVDYATPDFGSTLTLGTNPAVADAWQQIDREGTLWKTSVNGAAFGGVDRLAHYLSFVKPPGVQ